MTTTIKQKLIGLIILILLASLTASASAENVQSVSISSYNEATGHIEGIATYIGDFPDLSFAIRNGTNPPTPIQVNLLQVGGNCGETPCSNGWQTIANSEDFMLGTILIVTATFEDGTIADDEVIIAPGPGCETGAC